MSKWNFVVQVAAEIDGKPFHHSESVQAEGIGEAMDALQDDSIGDAFKRQLGEDFDEDEMEQRCTYVSLTIHRGEAVQRRVPRKKSA